MVIKLVNLTPITTRSLSLVKASFRPSGGDGEGGFKKSAATRVRGLRHSKRDLKWRKRERRGLSPSEKEQKDATRRREEVWRRLGEPLNLASLFVTLFESLLCGTASLIVIPIFLVLAELGNTLSKALKK